MNSRMVMDELRISAACVRAWEDSCSPWKVSRWTKD